MTNEQAQKKAEALWGTQGTTAWSANGRISPLYEVGVSYDTSNNCGIRFIVYGKGSSWTKAFADAKRSGR